MNPLGDDDGLFWLAAFLALGVVLVLLGAKLLHAGARWRGPWLPVLLTAVLFTAGGCAAAQRPQPAPACGVGWDDCAANDGLQQA